MATTIAISGKGGSGKTTLAAVIIRILCDQRGGAVLAVDADPNSCLGMTMGIEPVGTIAEVREKAAEKTVSNAGMDRVRSFEYGIQQSVTEGAGFDLLTMGRPEGPGCYCAANNLLRNFVDQLSSAYEFVVIDNEAGMEHLSRRTTNNVDLLCIVAEAAAIGAVTAQRIFDLATQLPISVKEIGIIWNNTSPIVDSQSSIGNKLDGIEIFGHVPFDESMFNALMKGKAILDIDEDSPAFLAMRKILEQKLTVNSAKKGETL